MPNYPFYIEEVELNSEDLFNESTSNIKTYLVISNAPINVEIRNQESRGKNLDKNSLIITDLVSETKSKIQEIADFLVEHGAEAEVVMLIHGYNTSESGFRAWVKSTYKFINTDRFISNKKRLFIGYRWPSESLSTNAHEESEKISRNFGKALKSLPILFLTIFKYSSRGLIFTLVLTLLATISTFFDSNLFRVSLISSILLTLGIAVFASFFGFVGCAIFLRVTNYFRDGYRAVNYGVPDLVEFFRQIDNAVIDKMHNSFNSNNLNNQRVRLSFIAHSMGAFVITNVIRILSDVFDKNSIFNPNKTAFSSPSPDIGQVFSLGRLVLASPDIPIESIMPERSNFLRTSLRRFEESYLFSNQGDIILRVASTAANYMSFPANTYERGFRLGNVVVNPSNDKLDDKTLESKSKLEAISYGIVNQNNSNGELYLNQENIESTVDNQKGVNIFYKSNKNANNNIAMGKVGIVSENKLQTLSELLAVPTQIQKEDNQTEILQEEKLLSIADFFTYFDCTDYIDTKYIAATEGGEEKEILGETQGILTKSLCKRELSFWDCFMLIFTSLVEPNKINVHGGYFDGQFSREMIYRIAFLGFKDFLNSLEDELNASDAQINVETIAKIAAEFEKNPTLFPNVSQEATKLMKLTLFLSNKCRDKRIKAFLSPYIYLDMLNQTKEVKLNNIAQ
jgi:hypothetical protein